jgi:hypothetical protein
VGESDGKFAKIDLLVNAAGVLVPKTFLEPWRATTDTLN